ncbi:DUF6035 family protein [Bacteroides acidifaciens]|uniref:DUF6035 family protein n=1 Tax=Bacteroides acidifaciens TaxID=85831 RepID=UPI0025758344|nr:DUF6035 family protein [Bacteroides acidifaciens]
MASKLDTYSDYSIPVFYDNRDGNMILKDTKEFFEGESYVSEEVTKDYLLKIRSEVSLNKSFLCGHCKRPIYISGRLNPCNRQKKLHFQHFHYDDGEECPFHDGKYYTQDEIRRMIFNGRQESPEHRKLKQIIKDSFIPRVGNQHVFEEPTLRGNDGGWRRPDIYVELPDKNVVFEVQLTYIFLSVITERNIVHRNNGRFVMWVFKDFGDGKGLTLDTERLSKLDIFAANNFNAFVLDDDAIEETYLTGNLHLTVYYHDYYNVIGRTNAKLGKALVSFDELAFDEERKLVYYFDSESKLLECKKELEDEKAQQIEDELNRQREEERKKRLQEKIEEEERRKDMELQEAEEEKLRHQKYKNFGKINKLFSSKLLTDYEMESLISIARTDYEFRQQALEYIYNFTYNHRRDSNASYGAYYQNSINFLSVLYKDYASNGKPNVITCLKRCWENLSEIAKFQGGRDYTIDALYSPSLSNINYKFFDFIFSPNHILLQSQRKDIQEWLFEYHHSSYAGKPGKDRYKHFYAWMVLLNDKVKKTNTLDLSLAQKLMKNKRKVIRAIISVGFGFLSGYNNDYHSLFDVVEAFKNDFPEYAGLYSFVSTNMRNKWAISELSKIASTQSQNHDLDTLISILFTKSNS